MDPFAELLSPFPADRFFSDHWNRAPLYIPGGEDKFAKLPGLKEFPSLLSGRLSPDRWAKGHVYSAQGSFIDPAGNMKTVNALPPMWPDLFNAGVSLCFSALDKYHEELGWLVKNIRTSTRFPGSISTTGYLTPPHSGSVMHFDSQHVFFMQVSGTKHWTIGQRIAWEDAPINILLPQLKSSSVKACFESIGATVACPEQTGLQELTLNKGDVLYLPPGVWHQGHTSDNHSLHYTLTLPPVGPWQLLVTFLRQSYFERPSLRRDLRYSSQSGDGDVRGLMEAAIVELKNMVDRLTAADVEQFFEELTSKDSLLKSHFMLP